MSQWTFNDATAWKQLKEGLCDIARQEVLSRFNHVSVEVKADGSLLTEADTQMQKATRSFLEALWPQFAFLGEESSSAEQVAALNSDTGCWILDPVDGTSNFASNVPFYSVSLALVIKGQVVVGMVYDPSRDELFAARKGLGAELNHRPLKARTDKTHLNQCLGVIDFKRLTDKLALCIITDTPYASQRSFGSVALDWCWIAAGRGQLYLHGAQNIWDYAAGYLILNEAGGQSCTLDGETVLVAEVEKRSAIAATTPQLFQQWQTYLSKAQS